MGCIKSIMYVVVVVCCSCNKGGSYGPEAPPELPEDSVLIDDNTPQASPYQLVAFHGRPTTASGGYYAGLPPDYDSTTEKYPLLLSVHGSGELGAGTEEFLPSVLSNGVAKRVGNKSLPTKFVSEGIEHSMIMIFPQFYRRPDPIDMKLIFDHLLEKYRIDTNRIYLTGLSMGGGVTWEYAASEYGKMLAAIVPICGATDISTDDASIQKIIDNDVPVWAFHNLDDHLVSYHLTRNFQLNINRKNPPHPVRATLWSTGWHDSWTKASNPNYREEGKNMYEWMLQYQRN